MVREPLFTKCPILIGGCGRSGTTLILSILSAHPSIFAIPHEMWSLWPTKNQAEFASLVQSMIDQINTMQIPPHCERWCEKTPKNVQAFGQLIDHFGTEVRLIHIVRDGRDVTTSIHPSDQSKFWVPMDRWIWDVRAGLEYEGHPQVLTIRYEDVVCSFEKTMRRVCEFIQEEWTDRLVHWDRWASVREHSALYGEMQALFGKSIRRWKDPRYAERVAEFMANEDAVSLLRHFRYE